ncbi:MAG TPA: hypothetical protein VF432_11160 [Thermoanaerobaculia bacterium]
MRDFPIEYRHEAQCPLQVVIFAENESETIFPPIAWHVVEHLGLNGWHRATVTAASAVHARVPGGASAILALQQEADLTLAATKQNGVSLVQVARGSARRISVLNTIDDPDPLAMIDLELWLDGGRYMQTSIAAKDGTRATLAIPPAISFALATGAAKGAPLNMAELQSVTPFEFGTLHALRVALIRNDRGDYQFVGRL